MKKNTVMEEAEENPNITFFVDMDFDKNGEPVLSDNVDCIVSDNNMFSDSYWEQRIELYSSLQYLEVMPIVECSCEQDLEDAAMFDDLTFANTVFCNSAHLHLVPITITNIVISDKFEQPLLVYIDPSKHEIEEIFWIKKIEMVPINKAISPLKFTIDQIGNNFQNNRETALLAA